MGQVVQQLGWVLIAFGHSFSRLWRRGYRAYLLAPVAGYSLLLALFFYYSYHNFHRWLNLFMSTLGYEPSFSSWFSYLLVISLQLALLFFFSSLLKYATLVLLAPFFSALAQKVAVERGGEVLQSLSLGQLLHDVLRAFIFNGGNFLRETALSLLLLLLTWWPFFNLFVPLLLLLVHAFYMGCGLMDFNAERWQWTSAESRRWMRRHRLSVTAVGLSFYGLWMIPLIGWLLAPVWSVMAGAELATRLKKSQRYPV